MTDENEDVLRRSLDAVDRHRKRLMISLAVASLALLGAFLHFMDAARGASVNFFTHAAMVMILTYTTFVGVVIVMQMTVMTKRILRAIELASRK